MVEVEGVIEVSGEGVEERARGRRCLKGEGGLNARDAIAEGAALEVTERGEVARRAPSAEGGARELNLTEGVELKGRLKARGEGPTAEEGEAVAQGGEGEIARGVRARVSSWGVSALRGWGREARLKGDGQRERL